MALNGVASPARQAHFKCGTQVKRPACRRNLWKSKRLVHPRAASDTILTMTTEQAPRPEPIVEEYDDGFGFETAEPEPVEPVSPLIAVIRIVSVLGMGLCISFGLFISLVGVRGMLIGIPLLLLSIPCFYGMQLAERWAQRQAREAAARET